MAQRLNFLHTFKKRVLREISDDGRAAVLTLDSVPADGNVYWVGGAATLPNGTEIDSVFRVGMDSGGTLLGVYWSFNGKWYASDDPEVLQVLKASKDQIFPFDWRYNTPLEEDIYHD